MKNPNPVVYSISILLLLSFVFGCAQDQSGNSNRQTILSSPESDSLITRKVDSIVNSDHPGVISKNWIDSLMGKYILLSNNVLVRAAVSNKLSEEGLFDQIGNTCTAQYFVYHVGHDVSDEGGINLRFIKDQWVYVDTAARILYEYDLPKDSLIRWSKK
jgi:hypothetical protein